MKIKQIRVKNFKSFEDQTISFEDFTLLVGANAAGKSNVINLFRFLSDMVQYGLDNAISLQGGLDYLTNASIGRNEPIVFSCLIEASAILLDDSGLELDWIEYFLEILPNKKGGGYQICQEQLKFICGEDFVTLKNEHNELLLRQMNVRRTRPLAHMLRPLELKIYSKMKSAKPYRELILNKAAGSFPNLLSFPRLVRLYDFDPTLMKQSSQIASVRFLKEDGSNLANILQRILKDKDKRTVMTNLLRECLPFVEGIEPVKNFDQSISYKIKEVYHNKTFHSNFLSDGTVNILALITALYFEEDPDIVIIEEPERNLHPKLMAKIAEMAKERSEQKQIIITTHNPEFVKYTGLGSLLFAKRSRSGFTQITKPADNKGVNIFLENELGLEDLFIQDILDE